MRRVLFGVIALIVLLVAGFVAVPFFQSRALGRQLAADVAAARANVVTRTPPPRNPQHDNGFACLAGMLKVTPRDLSPFSLNGATKEPDLSPWVRGDAPLDTVPPELEERARALSGWADEMRACGSSKSLKYFTGTEPWDDPPRHPEAVLALTRFTTFEVRRLVAEKQPQLALERCNATLAFALDQSHLGLLGAMTAVASVRVLASHCATAFNALSAEEKKSFAPQWVVLATRLASAKEMIETERLTASVTYFAPLVDTEGIPRVREAALLDSTMFSRYLMRRLWSAWDPRLRALVDVAEDPAGRVRASAEIDQLFSEWWVPVGPAAPVNYGKFAERLDEGRLVLSVLQWLANGASGVLPEGATRVDGGVEWKDLDGAPHVIPVAP